MKTVISFVVIALASVGVLAQQDGKVVAEIAARGDGSIIKGQPFSADAVSESVQTLADGNRIVHSSTSKFYRSGDGRIRREMKSGSGGLMGSLYSFEPGFTIMHPSGFRYMIDDGQKTARRIQVLPSKELSITAAVPATEEQKKEIQKLRSELRIVEGQPLTAEQKAAIEKLRSLGRVVESDLVVSGGTSLITRGGNTDLLGSLYSKSKYDTKSEDLGTSNFEGVEATGTRRTTTIPAGAIGNERPIEITYERWYSKELGVVVYSKNSDPRFGEQTYRLTNIVRAEPDPSLFTWPNGYKLITEPGGIYVTTKPGTKLRTQQQ